MNGNNDYDDLPDDLKRCVTFHGHLCPGLIYGYRVGIAAREQMGLRHSRDEEVVAVCETDSCTVDALQVLLGTTAGKGNLKVRNYGKNVFTVHHRGRQTALRFARRSAYRYAGDYGAEFENLCAAVNQGTATADQASRRKRLMALDLLTQPLDKIYHVTPVPFDPPSRAPMAASEPCGICGDLTMATRLEILGDSRRVCIPCSAANRDTV